MINEWWRMNDEWWMNEWRMNDEWMDEYCWPEVSNKQAAATLHELHAGICYEDRQINR